MATTMASIQRPERLNGTHENTVSEQDPFVDNFHTSPRFTPQQSWQTDSPSQLKRTLEAHLVETERRLQDAQKLGNSLLRQQSELTDKLVEVQQIQNEAEISPELRQKLAELEKEHNDVGKEIARALLGPKSRAVSGEEIQSPEKSVFTSQATGSPTKISAPSRRQRNQPSDRAGDLQFAADISTSLLAQVRQLQAAVAERDDLLKSANHDRNRLEQESTALSQRLRMFDDNEQRYKDENWNLETRNHDLLAAAALAAEREKKLNLNLSAALAAKTRALNESDDIKLAHQKLLDEHVTAKKSHDSELHALRRTMETSDGDRALLQGKVDELVAQNEELARAFSTRFRDQQGSAELMAGKLQDEDMNDLSTPEQSPPPSPTKATPRHGGLESDTLRSSLQHAHRMIQNLKNNIHREKTEKIELKRMLQDARDELEQRRSDNNAGTATKRQKSKPDAFKKPAKPDMLGGSRKSRTDVEMEEGDWEDHAGEIITPSTGRRSIVVPGAFSEMHVTDQSDAYNTATETEGGFETADERRGTETEDFQTGAESMAGDSTDDLTETEDTSVRGKRVTTVRASKLAFRPAGDRTSFMSTASTSADEDDTDLRTPIMASNKFRLKNSRQSLAQSAMNNSTPTSFHSQATMRDSPATAAQDRSPPGAEQSLFAELGGADELGSDRFGTPGRSSIASLGSSPAAAYSPDDRRTTKQYQPFYAARSVMVDAGTMTESPATPKVKTTSAIYELMSDEPVEDHQRHSVQSISNFPLPPSVPVTPSHQNDHGTQYTPQRSMLDSPIRAQAKFDTPPKTVWDEEQPSEEELVQTPKRNLAYSGLLLHDTQPISPIRFTPETPPVILSSFSGITSIGSEPISPPRPATPVPAPTQASASSLLGAGAVGGLLATAATALGLSTSDNQKEVLDTASQTRESSEPKHTSTTQLVSDLPVSSNLAQETPTSEQKSYDSDQRIPVAFSGNDQGCQTMLSGQDILQALRRRSSRDVLGNVKAPGMSSVVSYPNVPTTPTEAPELPRKLSSRAYSSAESVPVSETILSTNGDEGVNKPRVLSSLGQHPPLPPDHKAVIAKAGGKLSPTHKDNATTSQAPIIMGPPALPASAMRRPRTPGASSVKSVIRDSTVAGPSQPSRQGRGTVSSQISRRSSVSSFASDVDDRFNIKPNGQAGAYGFETSSGADPRMIQAITQTMIGEFLWKYTRKPGRSEMSETRHRRYFWVHPYTKTLYWSAQDPQSAGKNEIKAKSVAIESVRIIPDDNPMPPGIYRKSLEVTTPGRRVRFTAPTGQRHETWFNALNYLLSNGEKQANEAYITGNGEITRDDLDEFRVQGTGHNAMLAPPDSRQSMSSYNSRTTTGTTNRTSRQQAGSSTIGTSGTVKRDPSSSAANRATPTNASEGQSRSDPASDAAQPRTLRANSLSRFSRIVSSVTGRTPRASEHYGSTTQNETGSIYDASIVSESRRDSAEELRQEMLRQEQEGLGGLENVRACCDGKHDVSTLTRHPSASIGHHTHGVRHLSLGRRSLSRKT